MTPKRKQHGSTLITALIMLVVLTLLVISAIRSSNTNLRIAGNMQIGEEAAGAAQQFIELIISTNFTANPAASAVTIGPYPATSPTPSCTGSVALLNSQLDPTNPKDQPCFSSGTASNTGIFFTTATSVQGMSWCSSQQWDVQAQVLDPTTGANATTHQGISMRVPVGTTC